MALADGSVSWKHTEMYLKIELRYLFSAVYLEWLSAAYINLNVNVLLLAFVVFKPNEFTVFRLI